MSFLAKYVTPSSQLVRFLNSEFSITIFRLWKTGDSSPPLVTKEKGKNKGKTNSQKTPNKTDRESLQPVLRYTLTHARPLSSLLDFCTEGQLLSCLLPACTALCTFSSVWQNVLRKEWLSSFQRPSCRAERYFLVCHWALFCLPWLCQGSRLLLPVMDLLEREEKPAQNLNLHHDIIWHLYQGVCCISLITNKLLNCAQRIEK